MLFLVISTPRPESPSAVTARREAAWKWVAARKENKTMLWMHARVGRGAAALVDVESNLALHQLLNEWAELIPCNHDVYPLVDEESARAYLKVHAPAA